MKPAALLLPLILLLSACGQMRETVAVADDVYDIPDRTAMRAMAAAASAPATDDAGVEYYDPGESARASASEAYYNMTYNDPYYYNYGRFGFGTGIGSFGPGFGMGMSYGWPTSFGSMSIGYGTGFGAGYGYNPYWGNSWMSGYGYSPYGYDPFGYYGYGRYGYGYGGYGMGHGPYQGPWGGCYGCYEPAGFGQVVYGHRPSMAAGATGTTAPSAPRMMRNPAGLLNNAPAYSPPANRSSRSNEVARPDRILAPSTPARNTTRQPAARPSRSWDSGISAPSPSRSSGGGGGRTSSPRPR